MQHHYAEVNGVKLHYVAQGTGRLILFLHGFPEFWYAWRRQIAEFGNDFQAVALDMRGYNLSSKPADAEQYALPVLIEDVRALIEHLGHDRCVLAGHDWGGMISWHFALRHPEYLEKLVIINAPHPSIIAREMQHNRKQQAASLYINRFRRPEAEQMLEADNFQALQKTVLIEGLERGYLGEDDRTAYLEAWSQPGALIGSLNYYRAMGKIEHGSNVVQVPTLVIWGEQDTYLLPGNLDDLESFVPDLTLRRVPDATHWIVHEQPELVNSTIRAFIEDRS